MTAAPPDLSVQAVTKRYGARIAVDAVDLDLRRGRITGLLGPSGCGKSTLLRLIAGLEVPDAGQIIAAGAALSGPTGFAPPEHRGVGLVFQDYALFPHMTVLENVAFGLRGRPGAQRRRIAMDLLQRMRLQDRADAWPHMLSGGEQQRVALARALAPQPAVILLDEPFSGLDRHLKGELRDTLLATLRAAEAAVLVVTHDAEDALLISDDLALMQAGKILRRGDPEDCYRRPGSIATARMLGDINVLSVDVRAGRACTPFGAFDAGALPDGPAALLVRPEDLQVADEGAVARIETVRFAGATREVRLVLDGQAVRINMTTAPPPVGSLVRLRMVANAGLVAS
ncbi:ABC transporter ATP-binding protein [Phenylobacterium sp.]|uniref:ABC transporter ATP-binding protein n=1 Tax=Phenylobacterium sp. TaxID=1871053 RepID=UPI0028A06DD5|nr:ABC transporter ATP-binding protein [Phenylobacterium sp.]